jgi:uncharacterized protein YcbK (DUF882 family)
MNWNDIDFFTPEADKMLSCPCCGQCGLDHDFMLRIDNARKESAFSFKITSGFRCKEWNAKIGGVADSAHVKGLALDISAENSAKRFAILEVLLRNGFTRFGIGENFIHVDADSSKVQSVLWGYY